MARRRNEHHYDFWYEGKNNWEENKLAMASTKARIEEEFSGDQIDRPFFVQPTIVDKAKDAMFREMGSPQTMENWHFKNEMQSCLVTDCFWDIDFQPDNNLSWYRGHGAETFEEFRQPVSWKRLSELGGVGTPYVLNESAPPAKVYQGDLENFYLCQAIYAVSMKNKLVRDIFAECQFCNYDRLGMYMLRFYKNAQWTHVAIDDHIPLDKDNKPMCCRSEMFPSFPWPSIVEKAYAKLHKSWEAISGGGSVEEALTDLTGGTSGRFHTTDVAGDRLWKYFSELQDTTIWACGINERECGKRLIPLGAHYTAAVYCITQQNNVPYIGVFTSAPFSAVKHFPMCNVPMPQGFDYTNGFMWLRVDDFLQLFDAIYECRLVNSDLSLSEPLYRPILQEEKQQRLPTPGYDADGPWYELIFAYDGQERPISAANTPSFLIDVPEDNTVLIFDAGQICKRYPQSDADAKTKPDNCRHEQAPMLLRFFECSGEMKFQVADVPGDAEYMATASAAGEIYLVHMSAWAATRDAMCCVKVLRPGRYTLLVSMPSGSEEFSRMTFRCYSDRKVGVRWLKSGRNMITVNAGMPLSAIPYSLTGIPRIDEYREHLPRMFDEDEGKGRVRNGPEGWQLQVRQALDSKWGEEEPRGRFLGTFGGPEGGGSTNAVEHNLKGGCEVM